MNRKIVIYLVCAIVCFFLVVYRIKQGTFSAAFFDLLAILFGAFSLLAVIFYIFNKKSIGEIEKTMKTGKSQFARRLEESAKKKGL